MDGDERRAAWKRPPICRYEACARRKTGGHNRRWDGGTPHSRDRMDSSMDTLTRAQRSERMARIRSRNTGPELAVRRLVYSLGFRYRLHGTGLPGKPDLVFASRRKVIFVHGCFWHQHPGCGRQPKSRLEFWTEKLFQNRERDLRNQRKLRSLGWRILIVWECV